MINFIRDTDGYENNTVYYTDTDNLYVGMKYWDFSDKVRFVGENLSQRKNDCNSGIIFHSFFLALKLKCCLIIDEYGFIEEHITFKVFTDS